MSEVNVELLKQEILSLLVSAKNGLTEQELLNDYRAFNSNRELPYRDLGYPSLVSLLRSWTDVCRFQSQGNNGAMRILAVEEENTKHILSMVRGQRQGKSRRRGRGGRNRGRGGEIGRNGAPFVQGSFNSNQNRSGGGGRGRFNGRLSYNNNRSERPMVSSRPPIKQTNYNSRNKSYDSASSRFNKQPPSQQQAKPSMSFNDSRQANNPSFYNDRRVIDNSASIRITVGNNTNTTRNNHVHETEYNEQHLSDTASQFAQYQLPEEEEHFDGEDEEEAINNLQTLLTEYTHGIRLLALDELYQKKFGKSLLAELKIENILLVQDFVDDFALISRHGEDNGSCDHIITLKDPKQVEQTEIQLLQQITNSGIVSKSFRYANNLFSYINDSRFQGFVSDIDKSKHCLHIQPVRYQEHIETLMEELDSYYSSSISNSLIVQEIETGLACVTKYDGIYHRVFIKEIDLSKCVIVYVDYGTTVEINRDEQQFKYLLNHFAELPQMALACRLDDIYFLPNDQQWLQNTYNEVHSLCQHGPFFIEPTGYLNELLTIRILDADGRSLNDIVVEWQLAMRISVLTNSPPINQPEPEKPNVSKSVELTFNFLDNAAHCPLPDSGPSSPDTTKDNPNFKYPITSSNVTQQYKSIQLDENHSFYLIRHTDNQAYIPCFHLARLLHLSESEILSDTSLSRLHFTQTPENTVVFDCLKQTINYNDCLHIHQKFLFIFDLRSVLNYFERIGLGKTNPLIEVLRQLIDATNQSQFWNDFHENYKQPTPILSVQSPQQTDAERCTQLLARRNILCNMLRTNDVTQCTLELESIENELQQLIERMRLGSTTRQRECIPTTPPPGYSVQNEQNGAATNKLKDLMQRCKKLINMIIVLDDYIPIDNHIAEYIQRNSSALNSNGNTFQDERLYQHYSELLENLTQIVDDLRQRLPEGITV